jgi:lipopolysaccharide transport system ATP-binding protein
VKGRIASLLEVGTGFHGELSGRENIYLNGAIMGLRKWEIDKKLDEIIDFAGVERYIDTPVKRYSSGMYVRLAFAVAAHLEPDILIVDEVLAVGDAEFQKKCLGKMKDVSKGQGRTVLFVSHNMAAIKTLCKTGIVLGNGQIKYIGETSVAVSKYLKNSSESLNKKSFDADYDQKFFSLHEISLNPIGKSSDDVLDEYQEIELNCLITIKANSENLHFTYVLNNENGDPLFTFSHVNDNKKLTIGFNHIKCTFPKGYLNVGTYYLSVYLIENAKSAIFNENDIMSFSIQEGQREIGSWMGKEPGFIKPLFKWEINSELK